MDYVTAAALAESLAELYEVALPSGAAHHRATFEAERDDVLAYGAELAPLGMNRATANFLDDMWALLADVPEPTGKVHDEKCFTRHAPCLAARIHDLARE